MQIEQKLASLGIHLPPQTAPIGSFLPAVRTGNLLFVSGHASLGKDFALTGKVGRDVTVEQAAQAARQVAIDLLGTAAGEIGNLDRVSRIVKLLGMVNSAENFTDHPKVINGASNLLIEVFEERGKHARSAIGVAGLPANASVEIEMILEIAHP